MEKLTVLHPGLRGANSRHQDLKHLFETFANNIQAFFFSSFASEYGCQLFPTT